MGYMEKRVDIITDAGIIATDVYVATDIDDSIRPYHWYKALVVAGAREHGLPDDYVAKLELAPAIPDTDTARVTRNSRFLSNQKRQSIRQSALATPRFITGKDTTMAKATINLPNGTLVNVEGTTEEIRELLDFYG